MNSCCWVILYTLLLAYILITYVATFLAANVKIKLYLADKL